MKFTDNCLAYYYTPKTPLIQCFNGTVTLKGKVKYGTIFTVNSMIFKTAVTDKIREFFKDSRDTLALVDHYERECYCLHSQIWNISDHKVSAYLHQEGDISS